MYLLNIALILLSGLVLLYNNNSQQRKLFFCIMASFQWILLSGLRDESVGADTINYWYHYTSVENMDWQQVFNGMIKNIFVLNETEPGYIFLQKFLQIFSDDYQWFLIIVAILFFSLLGLFIYRNSSEPVFSFLLFSCLFYSFYAITGIRQTIATAIVVFIGFELIKKRSFIPFLLIVFLAYSIHRSAVVFIPYYFIANKKITRRYITTMAIFGLILIVLGHNYYTQFSRFLGYDQVVSGGTTIFSILMLLILTIAVWRQPQISKNNPNYNLAFNAMIIATIFTIMTWQNQGFMRVQQYYSLFIMILIPDIIKSFKAMERVLIYLFGAALLILLFLKNDPYYIFFWQN